jgi:hypothetical protein
MTGVPQEASASSMTEQIAECYTEVEQNLISARLCAVYALGDSGFDSLVDATRISVITPPDYKSSQSVVPTTRSDAHTIMVTGCSILTRILHLWPSV